MASAAAQKKMAVVCLMLLAVGLMVIGMADATDKATSCTDSVKDPRPLETDCICSKNCACAGKCILNEPGDVLPCFVNCVLKTGCICEDENNPGADLPLQ